MVTYQTYTFKAIGSTITINAELPENSQHVFQEIENYYNQVEKIASRFLPESQLNILNNNPNITLEVDLELAEMIRDAYYAYKITGGNFDPRIHKTLTNLGYVDTFIDNTWANIKTVPHIIRHEWKPEIHGNKIFIGEDPIDLGGIGKSFITTKASQILEQYTDNYFINAGGDIIFSGKTSEGKNWTAGIDNPYMYPSNEPVAIVEVTDTAVATSSTARLTWQNDNTTFHHIIDPKTGLPANNQIKAVTIIHPDLITAEIWSKSLFFETQEGINEITQNLQLPALWFTEDNKMHYNKYMNPYLTWHI